MDGVTFTRIKQLAARAALVVAAFAAFGLLVISLLWRDRASMDELPVPSAPSVQQTSSPVTATWFGVSTILFDDGETQILIDAFVSRPSLYQALMRQPVNSDFAMVNYFLNEYRIRRLAAVVPVHTHFDHAMDVGAIGNRTSASILGSESTAQVARGAGVPEDQIFVVEDGAEYTFGEFTVRLIESQHAPVGWRGEVPLPGTVDAPLELPARIEEWREGGSYSIVVSHPAGTTLVQGSGGIRQDVLDDVNVDVVMLGVGLIESLGRDYLEDYWQATVTSTGASLVIPVHFDDYFRPFGTIEPMPRFLNDLEGLLELFDEFRRTWDSGTRIYMPVFGEPMPIYPEPEPEA